MKQLIRLLVVLLLAVNLSACSDADPDDVKWTLVAQGNIVAMDSTTGVYVQGYIGMFGGDIDSKGVVDYRYTRPLEDGGLRQDLISTTYERITKDEYPGSDIVTLYQDAAPDGSDARVSIFRCSLESAGRFARCVMPDGQSMNNATYRVEIHVPPGTVVENFDKHATDAPDHKEP